MGLNSKLRDPLRTLLELPEQEKSERGLMHTPREIWQQPETWALTVDHAQGGVYIGQRFNRFIKRYLYGHPDIHVHLRIAARELVAPARLLRLCIWWARVRRITPGARSRLSCAVSGMKTSGLFPARLC